MVGVGDLIFVDGYVTSADDHVTSADGHVISAADHVISGDSPAGYAALLDTIYPAALAECGRASAGHVTSCDDHVTSGCDPAASCSPRATEDARRPEWPR